ncbi:neural cell adhesion molecule 1-B-like [Schistocerca piceifrons]|uniref:neural cell adhesion molecule 1-B-like n=1 Tax=Schistocerca piceifrons TaxID=274613 RepID=UPI001F5F0D12|nr:neural cell adhesion molecule 1-B-like [Schistocerca piceifrons]
MRSLASGLDDTEQGVQQMKQQDALVVRETSRAAAAPDGLAGRLHSAGRPDVDCGSDVLWECPSVLIQLQHVVTGFCRVPGTAADDTSDFHLSPHKSEPVVRFVDESYVVTCVSRGGEQMSWLGPDKGRIYEKGRVHVEGGKETLSLVFSRIEKKDKGKYTCVSRIQGQERSLHFELFVYTPIHFEDTPEIQEVKEKSNALVKCEVQGDPEPTIKWEVNGTSVDGIPRYEVGGDGLFISNVTLDDRGYYQCQAFQLSPHISNMQQKTIFVKVLHEPKEKNKKDTAYGFINGTKNLTCEVVAEPPPVFRWMKDDVTINEDENITIISDNDTSVLQLVIHNASSFGEYKCIATNNFGSREQTIRLKQGNKPEVPTFSIKEHTDDTIVLDITAPDAGDLKILSYRVEYILVQQGALANWNNANVVELEAPPYKIEGLMQDTKYTVRLAARNEAGLSDYTKEHSVTTVSRKTLLSSSSARSMHLVDISSYLLVLCHFLSRVGIFMNIFIQL